MSTTLLADELWHLLCPSLRLDTSRRVASVVRNSSSYADTATTKRRLPGILQAQVAPRSSQWGRQEGMRRQLRPGADRSDGKTLHEDEQAPSFRYWSFDSTKSRPQQAHDTKPIIRRVERKVLRKICSSPLLPDVQSASHTQRGQQDEIKLRTTADKVETVTRRMVAAVSTDALYESLRLSAAARQAMETRGIAEILVRDRRELPNLRLYGALIRSQADHYKGSADELRALLEEMQEEGLEPDAAICQHVLEVLAVHPDYILRTTILEYMKQRWIQISADGKHCLAVGLIKEQQFELALELLNSLHADGVPIEGWLHDAYIYALCNTGDIDEALQILQRRVDHGDSEISPNVWFFVLESASATLHQEAVLYVWRRQVEMGYLNPSSGTCRKVLTIAAREGNTFLATSVFKLLGNRATVFDLDHYEMLADTFIAAHELEAALSTLCIMNEAKVEVDEGSTRNLFKYLRQDRKRIDQAFEALVMFAERRRRVPPAALNCVIEAAVHINDLKHALELYKAHRIVLPQGPTTDTFNILLKGCTYQNRKDLAMFLASEMVVMDIKPDAITYDRLVLVCLRALDYEDGLNYYHEMKAQGLTPRSGTYQTLINRLRDSNDHRWKNIWADMEADGISVAKIESLLTKDKENPRANENSAAAAV